MVSDLLFLGQIEEILLEKFCLVTEMLLDPLGQCALGVDGPLEGRDDRNPEIAEQAGKVPRIRLDFGTKTAVARLRQEKLLHVDDGAQAVIGSDALGHGPAVAAFRCSIFKDLDFSQRTFGRVNRLTSAVIAVRTSEATSEIHADDRSENLVGRFLRHQHVVQDQIVDAGSQEAAQWRPRAFRRSAPPSR